MIRSSFEFVETLWTDVNSASNTVTPLAVANQNSKKKKEKFEEIFLFQSYFPLTISEKWMKIKWFEIVLNVFGQSIKGYIWLFSVLCFFFARQRQFA